MRPPGHNPPPAPKALPEGILYDSGFLRPQDRAEILAWLGTLRPLWEMRYPRRTIGPGRAQRSLLRPVYWLGNWQFACLDYYRPPHGTENRCVRAEPFPPVLARLVAKMEERARRAFRGRDLPAGWRLNTCLVNFYGMRLEDGKPVDAARVGEHKDFEPGPVASLSLGEKAMFQFVESAGRGHQSRVVFQQWLEDGSLQIFGGTRWKERTFHRVQRVETRKKEVFPPEIEGFETRRVNFTFRYVPEVHVVRYADMPKTKAEDVAEYVEQLAATSTFFAAEKARTSRRNSSGSGLRRGSTPAS